jgi:hypothetical protein
VADSYTKIIYASASVKPFSSKQLTDLLAKARAKNGTLHVSGLLLYHQGSFLQVLEGEDSVVSALYERIVKARHRPSRARSWPIRPSRCPPARRSTAGRWPESRPSRWIPTSS